MVAMLVLGACTPDKGGGTEGGEDGTTAGEAGTTAGAGSSGVVLTTGGSSATSGGDMPAGTTTGTSGPPGFNTEVDEWSGGDDTSTSIGASTSGSSTGGDISTSSPDTTGVSTMAGESSTSTGADETGGGSLVYDCNGCTCDGAISYCQVTWSPTMDPPKEHPDGACPFIEAGSYDYGCVLYPQGCDTVDCSCVPDTQPVCGCMDGGGMLWVNCDYP